MNIFKDQECDLVDSAVGQLEKAWKLNVPVDFQSLLPPAEHPSRMLVLRELVKADQECSWRLGKSKYLESYLTEWPELRGEQERVRELLEAECETRASFDALPTREELLRRFPDIAANVDLDRIAQESAGKAIVHPPGGKSLSDRESSTYSVDNTPAYHRSGGELKIGEMFGRYEILETLGIGGMGKVYRVKDTQFPREAALKIPHLDPQGDNELLERFRREGQAAAKIVHPHVCPIYDAGQIGDVSFIAMALIRGESLAARIKISALQKKLPDQREVAEIGLKIAQALESIHEAGIVHRDIKPANVMIDTSNQPQLMDFGLARETHDERTLTKSNAAPGTLTYMPPEQIDGHADARSDLYSLGMILYEFVVGVRPFEGGMTELINKIVHELPPPPRKFRPDLEPALEAIILKALSKKPADRYQSAGEMAADLKKYLLSPALPPPVPPRRHRRLGLLAAAAAAAMFLTGTVIYIQTDKGTVVVTVEPQDAKVTVNGEKILIKSPRDDIAMRVGQYELEVSKDDFITQTKSFKIERGGKEELSVKLIPYPDYLKKIGKTSSTAPPPSSEPKCPTLEISRWLETEPSVNGISLSKDGATLYVAYWEDANQSRIQIFDVSSGNLVQTIPFGNMHTHGGVVLSADERYLYTTNYYMQYISRIDLKHDNERKDILIGGVPHAVWANEIGATPNRRLLLVSLGMDGRSEDLDNDQISIVNIANDDFSLVEEVRLKDEPTAKKIGFTSDSKFAYVIARKRKSPFPTLYEIRLTPPCEVTRSLPFPEGELSGVAISSKLKRIFVSDHGHRKIWAIDFDSFKTVDAFRIADYAPETLALNYQENMLAVICPESRKTFLLNPASGAIMGQVDALRPNAHDAVFTKDGRKLFISIRGGKGGVAITDVSRLYPPSSIVFTSNRDGESYQIYRMDANGRDIVRLTSNHATDCCPQWSPDGQTIAFISNRDGRPKIYLMNRDGHEVKTLEKTDPILSESYLDGTFLAWSPDGSRIAFIGDERRAVRLVDIKSGDVKTIVQGDIAPNYSNHGGVAWSKADGAIIISSYYSSTGHAHRIFRLDPEQMKPTEICNDEDKAEIRVQPVPAPDGKRIAVLQLTKGKEEPHQILLMDHTGVEERELSGTDAMLNGAMHWSSDGNRLVYSSGTRDLQHVFIVGIDGQKPIQLTAGNWSDIQPDICGD